MKKIVLIGPESTAKSTLGVFLSRRYGGEYIPEYSRRYAIKHEGGTHLSIEDVMPIVHGQLRAEDACGGEIAFLDSNPLGSAVYSAWYYNAVPEQLEELLLERKYDFYLLCAPDIPWEEDSARCMSSQKDREDIFLLFLERIEKSGVPYAVVHGEDVKRIECVCDALAKIGFTPLEKIW